MDSVYPGAVALPSSGSACVVSAAVSSGSVTSETGSVGSVETVSGTVSGGAVASPGCSSSHRDSSIWYAPSAALKICPSPKSPANARAASPFTAMYWVPPCPLYPLTGTRVLSISAQAPSSVS